MSEFRILDDLTPDALIPDGIEPIEALRCWDFIDGKLISLTTSTEWTPMEPLVAKCEAPYHQSYSWTIVRGGWTREQANKHAHAVNSSLYAFGGHGPVPVVFSADLPSGYGYKLEAHTHDAPDENCCCGIYAATDSKAIPRHGDVYGKVKLWGKVIPGERGFRAQYAYPSEFEVPADLADHPALKAFGVPITVVNGPFRRVGALVSSAGLIAPLIPSFTAKRGFGAGGGGGPSLAGQPPRRQRGERWLRVAVAANLAACAVNLVLIAANLGAFR